ncbi:MAG TPA: hypothetical protein PKO22_04150 [Treponemataceae bacterium]|nr:hypothetical protein [Treponemataceae bacterium]
MLVSVIPIGNTKEPRDGWYDAFIRMHDELQDTLLIAEPDDTEAVEWEW